MTETSTDLQKPFTDEELKHWAKTGGAMQSLVAKRLAARVLELEDQNARLQSLLVHVENADYDHTVGGCENFNRLQEIASAGLEANT